MRGRAPSRVKCARIRHIAVSHAHHGPVTGVEALLRDCPRYAPSPLLALPALAADLGVADLLVKDESQRLLGSFKSLGGAYASLQALSAAAGLTVEDLITRKRPAGSLPSLVCASAGNHGLAVAAAARLAGTHARIYISSGVPAIRVSRLRRQGAEVVLVEGTYDDAVRAAAADASSEEVVLVADTSADPADPTVAGVMDGYRVIAGELRSQLDGAGTRRPTHLFVQAGVGGLAAALTDGLRSYLDAPARVVVVEPESADCVGRALAAGRPCPVPGSPATSATMLACAEASAPAFAILSRYQVDAMTVPEDALLAAPARLAEHGGPATTPSGGAGLAGLATALSNAALARSLELVPRSRVLAVVTEGPET